MRTCISIVGNSDYGYAIRELSQSEYDFMKGLAYELDANSAELSIEKIPSRVENIEAFEKYQKDYETLLDGMTIYEKVHDFVMREYVGYNWNTMMFLENEIITFID